MYGMLRKKFTRQCMVYIISISHWVSPIPYVLKKEEMLKVKIEEDEIVATKPIT